jgi:hypothetical protein
MPPGTQPFPRIPYAINKGHQLNTVTSQVLTEIGWPKWNYGHVMSGYVEDCGCLSSFFLHAISKTDVYLLALSTR